MTEHLAPSRSLHFLPPPPLSLVPFDEDDKDDSVWFLDHDYLENMYGMFKKVNGKSEFLIACVLWCVSVFKSGVCLSLLSRIGSLSWTK